MDTVQVALLMSALAASADVVGGLLAVVRRLNAKQMTTLTSLAAGLLLGATLLDRLPDSMTQLPKTAPLLMVIGYVALFLFERAGFDHHHGTREAAPPTLVHELSAAAAWFSLLAHTFMDGVVIAGAFTIGQSTGFLMFIAITMHKIPEGLSLAALGLAAGKSRRTTLVWTGTLALSTLVGACVTLGADVANTTVLKGIMAFATGTFLYISTTGMVAELREHKGFRITASLIAGVAVFYASLKLIQQVGLS